MKEAEHYKKRSDGKIGCLLCPHACILTDGEVGYCGARKAQGDKLFSLNYGQATSIAMDPIEKKPLYHFHPGTEILSIGTFGCSFHCDFCQNYEISQGKPPTYSVTSGEIVKAAKERNSIGIAYTYNEPFIWFEFVKETSELARREGLANVLVTNGYINPQPLAELLPLTDAANVDVKSIREDFYKRLCKAKLRPVLDTCIAMVKAKVHVEVTNLIIPGENDTDEEFKELSSWICDNLGKMTPVHLSAYFPHYKLTAPPTPAATLERAYEIFSKVLPYTYLGNVLSSKGSSTDCPGCSAELISRRGYDVNIVGLNGRKCANCGREIEIIK